ncbi:MAG: hypothetical protein KGM43_12945 [Planctomycetota bacterium]|nr:hypothetical protein [Planctomycetota bacterium]
MSDSLENRVEKLERKLRRSNLENIFMFGLMAVMWLASIVLWIRFNPSHFVKDEAGKVRISAGSEGGNASVGFFDAKQHMRLIGGTTQNGQPVLYLLDLNDRKRIGIDLHPGDHPFQAFYDWQGNARIMLKLSPNGQPSINMSGRRGKGSILMSIQDDGNPVLRLLDKDGKTVFETPAP